MHHLATLTVGPFKASGKPYHIECSCGSAGDFNLEVQAVHWFKSIHVARIGPTETSELVVPGAAAPPPPPPAPDSKEKESAT